MFSVSGTFLPTPGTEPKKLENQQLPGFSPLSSINKQFSLPYPGQRSTLLLAKTAVTLVIPFCTFLKLVCWFFRIAAVWNKLRGPWHSCSWIVSWHRTIRGGLRKDLAPSGDLLSILQPHGFPKLHTAWHLMADMSEWPISHSPTVCIRIKAPEDRHHRTHVSPSLTSVTQRRSGWLPFCCSTSACCHEGWIFSLTSLRIWEGERGKVKG